MLDLFRNAGWAAWPLGLCSLLAVAIVLERLATLAGLKRMEAEAFARVLQNGEAAVSGEVGLSAAPLLQVRAATLPLAGAGADTRAQAEAVALAQQRLRLRRFLPGLATIGSTSPFIGLFGTVLGVMTAFRGMSTSGLSGETMASGISEALSATALGLLVAIPSVLAYNYFLGVVQNFLLEIESHVVRVAALAETGEGGA